MYAGIRVAVEWIFGSIKDSLQFLDFKISHKTFKHPAGEYFVVGAFIMKVLPVDVHVQAHCWRPL